MKDFMLLFHNEMETEQNWNVKPEDMQEAIKEWQDWIGGIAAQGKLKNEGDALGFEGKTLHSDGSVTDGPYAEIKEIVGGYIICIAKDIDEAINLAKGCPVLNEGGKVEVREIMNLEME